MSDDAAYIYSTWGFGYIHEMELLPEAGFHPPEVIRGPLRTSRLVEGDRTRSWTPGDIADSLVADSGLIGDC